MRARAVAGVPKGKLFYCLKKFKKLTLRITPPWPLWGVAEKIKSEA